MPRGVYVRTPKMRANMSVSQTGHLVSRRTRFKIGDAHKGRQHRLAHGHSLRGQVSPTYRTWRHMISRCTNLRCINYPSYGGRGISVCDRWKSFENFLEDMGERPEYQSIDRIDSDGNYEPSNCRWATSSEQRLNRRT